MENKVIDNVSIVAVVAIIAAVVIVALVFGRSLSFRGNGEQINIDVGDGARRATLYADEELVYMTSDGG